MNLSERQTIGAEINHDKINKQIKINSKVLYMKAIKSSIYHILK